MFTKTGWFGLVLTALSLPFPLRANRHCTGHRDDSAARHRCLERSGLVAAVGSTRHRHVFRFQRAGHRGQQSLREVREVDGGSNWTFGFLKNADGTPWIDPQP